MFRDFKTGGYHLENTKVEGERFISLVLLIAIAYTSATFKGQNIKRKGIQNYVGRVKEYGRIERRHSGATPVGFPDLGNAHRPVFTLVYMVKPGLI